MESGGIIKEARLALSYLFGVLITGIFFACRIQSMFRSHLWLKSKASMASSRQRFAGTADSLAKAIASAATCPTWLRYTEDMKGKSNVPVIKKHRSFILKLRAVQENLCFTKKQVEKSLQDILTAKADGWDLKTSEHTDWKVTTAMRIRVMCRHVYVAMKKTSTAEVGPRDLRRARQ